MLLETNRFLLRPLDPITDDFSNYLKWMRDVESNLYISGVKRTFQKDDLLDYVISKNEASNALLLGIFDKVSLCHIGNVKLEPIVQNSYAYIGILIGEIGMRNKGVGFEVIRALVDWAFSELHLSEIRLGVSRKNAAAIALYRKLGFNQVQVSVNSDDSFEMVILKKTS